MGILSWLVVGLIAGWLASMVMGTRFGCLGDVIVGVIGGLLGGWIAANFLGVPDAMNTFDVTSIMVAFAGAVILLFVLRLLRGGRR